MIFDLKQCSESQKQSCLPYWRPVVASNQARVWSHYLLHSVMSTYNIETMLGSRCVFNSGNTQIMDWYLTQQKGAQSPQNEHVYTFWRPVVISNQARECSHYFDSCLHINQRLCWALIAFFTARNKLIFDPKGWSEPPKQAYLHLLAAYHDL